MPDASKLLADVCEHAVLVEDPLGRANIYRQAAVLHGRSGDVKTAYATLDRIKDLKGHLQTPANLRRAGFLEMIDDVARHIDAKTALDMIESRPAEYFEYADDAFGRVAMSAARRGDAQDARQAIGLMETKGIGYPYELMVCVALDDRKRGKELLLEMHRMVETPNNGLMSREIWFAVTWSLSLYKWCGMTKESDELMEWVLASSTDPERDRAAVRGRLNRQSKPQETSKPAPVTKKKIREQLASANAQSDIEQKAQQTIEVVKLVLQFGRPIVSDSCVAQ